MNTNKKAITPIVATILLVVVAVILLTIVLNWGRDFSNKSLSTADTEKLSKSNASEFVYTRAFSDGVIQFNYGPPDSLTSQNVVITGYKILSNNNETVEIVLDSNYTLSQGLNIIPLTDFSDQNITSRRMNIELQTSDGKYITLRNITNPSPYVAPEQDEEESGIPEGVLEYPVDGKIWYLEHLAYIDTNATTLAGAYTLMRDLNFLDSGSYYSGEINTDWTTGTGWDPIGTSAAKFTGSLDGNNHKISNLYINRPTTGGVGLFNSIVSSYSSPIKNIGLIDINVIGYDAVGGLAGYLRNAGIINNCSVNGYVYGNGSYVGGLIGSADPGEIIHSQFIGSVQSLGNYVGGIIGEAYILEISFSYSSGEVKGNNYVGGLVGVMNGSINNCYSSSIVDGNSSVAGLVAGTYGGQDSSVIENSYSTGDVYGLSNTAGFIMSANGNTLESSTKIRNCYSTSNVFRKSGIDQNFAGFIGKVYGASVINSYSTGSVSGNDWNPTDKGFSYTDIGSGNFWDMNTSGQTTSGTGATGKTTVEMKQPETFSNWDLDNIWEIEEDISYPKIITPYILNPRNKSLSETSNNFIGSDIGIENYICSWSSNVDGYLGTGCDININNLTTGINSITLNVNDVVRTIDLNVIDYPQVAIVSPEDGKQSTSRGGDIIYFESGIYNIQGDYNCVWNSSLDGNFSNACYVTKNNSSFTNNSSHTITLYVTDESQNVYISQITFYFGYITAPGCAFIYSFDGEKYNPEQAISDFAVHKEYKYPTYGILKTLKNKDNHYKLGIWEQVPETQYIDTIELWKLIHPKDTTVIAEQTTGILHTIKEKEYPIEATGTDNQSYLSEIIQEDDSYWVTNMSNFDYINPPAFDELYLKFPNNNSNNEKVKLVVRAKDTGLLSSDWRNFVTLLDGTNKRGYEYLNSENDVFEDLTNYIQNTGLLYIYQKINEEYQLVDSFRFGNVEFYHTWAIEIQETEDPIELKFVGLPYAHQIDEVYLDRSVDEEIEIVKIKGEITETNTAFLTQEIKSLVDTRDYNYFKLDLGDYILLDFYDDSNITLTEEQTYTTLLYADAYSESYSLPDNEDNIVNGKNIDLLKEIISNDTLVTKLFTRHFYENTTLKTSLPSVYKIG